MAKETADEAFIGTDFQRIYHVLNEDEDEAIDISGWALSWMLKRKLTMLDADASVTKSTATTGVSIGGLYNATPGSNLQRATVTILDTDTDALAAGIYYYELKRTDAGLETVLAYGEMELLRGVHRA